MNNEVKIVALGASAGGLEALSEFLAAAPVDETISYLVAQHLAPDTTSLLTDLLSRQTELNVVVAPKIFTPVGGTVYIVPPNNDLELVDGMFKLAVPEQKIGPKPSINRLLKSIAASIEEEVSASKSLQVCGIILSGTGTDGALGLTALKAAGGVTGAQDPASAKYNGMPMAAIHARAADVVGTPAELGKNISEILMRKGVANKGEEQNIAYYKIISFVKEETNIDLTNYKPSTVERRMFRRRDAVKVKDLDQYLDYLRKYPQEANSLIQEVLIPVTEFFRDNESFKVLEQTIVEKISAQDIAADGVLRIWCAGCATGEEAYSIAIMIEELLPDLAHPLRYQIFATDLDENALKKARYGVYPLTSISKIPLKLQKRYFEIIDDTVKIRQDIRDRITFTAHNLVQDPPFGRIDVVSCRNLLIYFNGILQSVAFDTFNYSLNSNGILFLGRAETINDEDQFVEIDRHHKIYVKNDNYKVKKNFSNFRFIGLSSSAEKNGRQTGKELKLFEELDVLRSMFGESFMLLKNSMNVRYVGKELPFKITPKTGLYADDVSDILPTEVISELKILAIKARRTLEPSSPIWINLRQEKKNIKVQIILYPIKDHFRSGDLQKGDFVVYFQDVSASGTNNTMSNLQPEELSLVGDLQLELALARQVLQSTVEELETANEELQAINEEMQSSNEELQSTNEELQTTNEELQSTNEELLTVNDEVVEKNIQLSSLTDDLRLLRENIKFKYLVVSSVSGLMSHNFTRLPQEIDQTGPKFFNTQFGKFLLDYIENDAPPTNPLSVNIDNVDYNLEIFQSGEKRGNEKLFFIKILN